MTLSEKKVLDMTSGGIFSLLIRFSIPLLLGNLFQQFYNTVDTIIIGNYVGREALAAVGSTTSFINTLVGFFMGLSSGAGVVVSQFFGAKEYKKLNETVHTAILATLILGVVFTFLGISITPYMLKLMSTPADVFPSSELYLKIYFGGILFLMLYNVAAGILQALGDSTRPFIFLVISTFVNIVLDLVFVLVFDWGIAGVAYATVIAQALSAILVLITMICTDACYKLSLKSLKLNAYHIRLVLKIGLPGALQMAVTSFSNVFVQAYINSFGSACMAGWATYNKIDMFIVLPIMSIGLASTTFVGQNYGAKNIQRLREGVKKAYLLSVASTIILTIPVWIFAAKFALLFNGEADVVYFGVYFLRVCCPFYFLICPNQIFSGALRGVGNATAPTVIMLASFVVFRQMYLFIVSKLGNSFLLITLAYPAGWVLCSVAMTVYYLWYMNKSKFAKNNT